MDDELRHSLWNAIHARLNGTASTYGTRQSFWYKASCHLAKYLYKVPVDDLRSDEHSSRVDIRARFLSAPWFEAYDTIEFLAATIDVICGPEDLHSGLRYYQRQQQQFVAELNHILQRELAGYRFIEGVLAPITASVEVRAISEAATAADDGAATHIRSALALLGRKPQPDYRNSIKESISAVEAAVNTYAGTAEDGVAKAIEAIGTKLEIHPSLRAAIKKLYGYASDEDGIRHAILDQKAIGYAEAAYMLVICSALLNFLKAKHREVPSK